MWSRLAALQPSAGGKRKLLGEIFKYVPSAAEAPIFVDALLGGGSISLYAKARGYKVAANDIAFRAEVVGRALIENSHVRLDYDDLVRLSMPIDEPGYAETHLAPDVFPRNHAHYLDRFVVNSEHFAGAKRWLALLLIIKVALRLRPMGNFGARSVMKQAAAGEWGAMKEHFAKDLIQRGLPRHPIRMAETIRKQINAGVFSNGHENHMCRVDVFDFLTSVKADVAYFDPPYFKTQSYERALKPLDELLQSGPVKVERSPFTTEPPERILPRLFEAAEHIPTWVLSYGNQHTDLETLMSLMKKFRPRVEGQAINFVHCTGLAGAESRRRNQELIVVGRK